MGESLAKNINHTFENKLDYYNKVFWVTTNDDDVLSNDSFYNPFTKSYPKILHVIGGRRENEQLYKEIYSKILNLLIIMQEYKKKEELLTSLSAVGIQKNQ